MAGQSQADSNVPLLDQIPIQPEDPDVQSSAVVATSQGVAETSTFESQYADSAFDAVSVTADVRTAPTPYSNCWTGVRRCHNQIDELKFI